MLNSRDEDFAFYIHVVGLLNMNALNNLSSNHEQRLHILSDNKFPLTCRGSFNGNTYSTTILVPNFVDAAEINIYNIYISSPFQP